MIIVNIVVMSWLQACPTVAIYDAILIIIVRVNNNCIQGIGNHAHTTPKDRDECVFPQCSREDFCNGYYNIVLDPKYIPKLTSFFKYCFETFVRERSLEGTFRRHMLLKLLGSATPVVHKAYFDQKTSLKDVADFIKTKLDVMDFNLYAETLEGEEDPNHRWKDVAERHAIIYSPCGSSGTYSPEDEKFHCEQLQSKSCPSLSDVTSKDGPCGEALNKTKLINVRRVSRVIEFPIVNITAPSSSEDTSFLILDMYVLASRCLRSLKNIPCAECELEEILGWIRKAVLPHVNIKDLEKVYDESESVTIKTK